MTAPIPVSVSLNLTAGNADAVFSALAALVRAAGPALSAPLGLSPFSIIGPGARISDTPTGPISCDDRVVAGVVGEAEPAPESLARATKALKLACEGAGAGLSEAGRVALQDMLTEYSGAVLYHGARHLGDLTDHDLVARVKQLLADSEQAALSQESESDTLARAAHAEAAAAPDGELEYAEDDASDVELAPVGELESLLVGHCAEFEESTAASDLQEVESYLRQYSAAKDAARKSTSTRARRRDKLEMRAAKLLKLAVPPFDAKPAMATPPADVAPAATLEELSETVRVFCAQRKKAGEDTTATSLEALELLRTFGAENTLQVKEPDRAACTAAFKAAGGVE